MNDHGTHWKSLEADRRAQRRRLRGVAQTQPVTAIALSGGGIRSATVSLGALQALAGGDALRHIDYLSTVSGGGYAGSFLCSLYVPERVRRDAAAREPPTSDELNDAAASAERQLSATEHRAGAPDTGYAAAALDWLRNSGRYLAPNGGADYRYAAAMMVRNWLGIHYVIGISLLTLFMLLALLHRWLAPSLPPGLVAWGDGSLWALLGLAVLGGAVVPLGVGYWYAERPPRESRRWWAGLTTFSSIVGLLLPLATCALLRGVTMPSPTWTAWGQGITVVLALAWLWYAFGWTVTRRAGAAHSIRAMQGTRTRLTRWLSVALGWSAALLALAAVLAASHWLLAALARLSWPGLTGAGALAAMGSVWKWVSKVGEDADARRRQLALQWLPLIAACVMGLLVLLVWGTAAAWLVANGSAILPWLVVAALLLSWVTGVSFQFLNLSTFQNLYTARLVRAYLGASNRARIEAPARSPWRAVTEPHPNDDMSLAQYYGPAGIRELPSLAPQHLINVTLNCTVAARGALVQQDRKGLPLAVTPHGYQIDGDFRLRADAPARRGADRFEPLSVGRWTGISGAAVAPGLGRGTRPERSVLLTLGNVRLGYWWRAQVGRARIARSVSTRLFSTQVHLLREALGRFHGTNDSHWYLSDGGHFENTAVYELLRRRAAVILALDNGADPDYRFGDLANLIRVASVDFGARFEPLTPQDLAQAWAGRPHAKLAELFGDPQGFACDLRVGRHFLLAFRVVVPPGDGFDEPHVALLVFFKPRVTQDDAADVVQYQAAHPSFPQESTAEQFFDDEQWESYRHLGMSHVQRMLEATGAPQQPFTALLAALDSLRV